MPKLVLFLCTGNYYRSRFAEIVFNHFASSRSLDWRADSRGLAREFGAWNVGPISPYTLQALLDRNIGYPMPNKGGYSAFEALVKEEPSINVTVEQLQAANQFQFRDLDQTGLQRWNDTWTAVKAA